MRAGIMTSVSWLPEKLTILLTSEPTARVASLGLCGIDVGARGELRTAELLLLRPRLGAFSFSPGAIQDLRKRWGVSLDYNPSTDCAIIAVSNVPSHHSDGCDAKVELTRTGEVAKIIIEGKFRSP
jgi:hypothetical protein